MKPCGLKILFILYSCLFFYTYLFAENSNHDKYWIYFKNKGPTNYIEKSLKKAGHYLSEKSVARRIKHQIAAVDYADLPVWSEYIQQLDSLGVRIVHSSKWLNAVSVIADQSLVEQISILPFVTHIDKVASACRNRSPEFFEKKSSFNADYYDYGFSLQQNDIIGVPSVHQAGNTGENVLIAIFDTGFNVNHEAFASTKILSTWDFINGDSVVSNESGQDMVRQHKHGTEVLSVVGGYAPGNLIGSAFNAEFLLAKTEIEDQEIPVEEDHWIAAAEWADSIGADIISSSVGYLDWYSYEDMDGNTAPITIAADMAVKKGIVVVVAAGNEANLPWHYITAPADGDSVITVGSVLSNGILAGSSSRGPTFDNRIKPEVVAMGAAVYTAKASAADQYGDQYQYSSGTSFACPIVAGVAALILSKHPELTAMQVREALIKTASRSSQPDNSYGYGLVDAPAAVNYWDDENTDPETNQFVAVYPNPFIKNETNQVNFSLNLKASTFIEADIFNIHGQKVTTVWNGFLSKGNLRKISWSARNAQGDCVKSGIYFCRIKMDNRNLYIKFTVITGKNR